MDVEFVPEARQELEKLRVDAPREYRAMQNAVEKLTLFGNQLGAPHSSNVEGESKLRELRPRGGRSPWRSFYRQISDSMVIGAIGPEAESDPPGFRRAIRAAAQRLDRIAAERGA